MGKNIVDMKDLSTKEINALFYNHDLLEAFNYTSEVISKRIFHDFEPTTSFLFLIGKGFNGLDGIILSTTLLNKGCKDITLVSPYSESTLLSLKVFKHGSSIPITFNQRVGNLKRKYDVVIDCLVGSGFKGDKAYGFLSSYKTYLKKVNSIIISIDESIAEQEPDYTFSIGRSVDNNSIVVQSPLWKNFEEKCGPGDLYNPVKKTRDNSVLLFSHKKTSLNNAFFRLFNTEITHINFDNFLFEHDNEQSVKQFVSSFTSVIFDLDDLPYRSKLIVKDIISMCPDKCYIFVSKERTYHYDNIQNLYDSVIVTISKPINIKEFRASCIISNTSQVISFTGERKVCNIPNHNFSLLEIAFLISTLPNNNLFDSSKAVLFWISVASQLMSQGEEKYPALELAHHECIEFVESL